jgi:hypothetical protein
MANTLQLKNDIKKIKSALASKGLSATFKNKLKVKLEKAESDLKNSTPKGAKATLTSLKEQVKKRGYGVYKGAGVDLKKDAEEPALAIGRRVSKGIKGNQYGNKKSSKGNVYYEYRANRLDVKQPSKTAKYPKLEDGGMMAKGGEMDKNLRYYIVYLDIKKGYAQDIKYFDTNEEAENWRRKNSEAKLIIFQKIGIIFPGMMAKGGENTTELQKYLEVASERAFAGGGNGVNITDYGLSEVAIYIDQDIYTNETKNLFKKLVDSMVKDEIKNNQVGANNYKNGGMMAHGGKLSKKDFFKKYEENEDENMHTENVVLLAENYGTESDIRDAKTILAKHESIGHLPTTLRQERDDLHDKLYAKYVQSREDGGMMADGGRIANDKQRFGLKILKSLKGFNDGQTLNGVLELLGYSQYRFGKYATESQVNEVKNQLDILIKMGYVEESGIGYKITKEGSNFLNMFDYGSYAQGGVTEKEVVDSNAQMVLSNVKEVKHHAEELSKVVTKKSNIEAWVVAKIERASTDLSDVTHYLEGQHDKMSMGGSVYNHLHKMDKK